MWLPLPLFFLRRSLMAARIIFLSSKSFDSSSCGRKEKHTSGNNETSFLTKRPKWRVRRSAVPSPNIPSHSCRDLLWIRDCSEWPKPICLLQQSGATESQSPRIITWVWSTILSRSSSSSMAASCSAVIFPERSSGLAWVLEPLGMAGTWHGTWTDGPTENTGSEATTGSVSICVRHITQTNTAWARARACMCKKTHSYINNIIRGRILQSGAQV